jgi:hypothetical protein
MLFVDSSFYINLSLAYILCVLVHENEQQTGFDQAQELNDRGIHDDERR